VLLLGGGWDLLVGHSLGGTIAGALVEADPGFTGRVVYEDPAADWELASEFIMDSPDQIGLATAADVAAEHPGWHANDVRYKVEALHACRPDVETRTIADVVPRDLWSVMIDADVPGLVIAADPEVGSLVSAEQEAQAASHRLRVIRVTGAGHSVHRDAPEEFMALVAEFATVPVSLSGPG
jgi:pimeloyl-ACP methyl ester carboxylesterase